MKNRKDQFHNDPWERDFYGTGFTEPPKNRGGVIAGLLIAVIVLGSFTTGLGIMNIRLFQMLEDQNHTEESVQLIQPQVDEGSSPPAPPSVETGSPGELGLLCSTVTEFDTQFYRLPYGCLITQVKENSCSDKAGLYTGDVIVSMKGHTIQSVEELSAVLEDCYAGENVTIVVYRSRTNRHVTLEVTLDQRGETE